MPRKQRGPSITSWPDCAPRIPYNIARVAFHDDAIVIKSWFRDSLTRVPAKNSGAHRLTEQSWPFGQGVFYALQIQDAS